jgi:hypothetical protein
MDERGSVMVFTLFAIIFLLVVGGLAVDLAWQYTVRTELQRSMDAAALAGAGKLGFDNTVFPTARQFAVDFAQKNPFHVGTVSLNSNVVNDTTSFDSQSGPYGDVVLGIWDPSKPQGVGSGQRFAPSLDGTQVNAVMCRYKTTWQTSLLRLWGMNNLSMSAAAIATADPPATPPQNACTLPIALSMCPFRSSNAYTSSGCGVPVTFVTSNGQSASSNTAAWVNLSGTGNSSPTTLKSQIDAANNGTCTNPAPSVGTSVGVSNGMDSNVFNEVTSALKTQFATSQANGTNYTIKKADGTVAYNGPGWEIYVPVVETTCNADGATGAMSGNMQLLGWTRFVMTQAWDSTGGNKLPIGLGCAVNNPWDTNTWPYCLVTKSSQLPAGLQSGASRSIFGYYQCGVIKAPPVRFPVPRVSLATNLVLVQ